MSPLPQAEWLRLQAEGHHALGQKHAARQLLHQALGLLGQPWAESGWRRWRAGIWGLIQLLVCLRRPATGEMVARWQTVTRLYFALNMNHGYENEYETAGYTALQVMLAATHLTPPMPETAFAASIFYGLCRFFGRTRPAEAYRQQALEQCAQINHLETEGLTNIVVSVWDTGFRPWTEIRQRYEHGLALLKQTRHWYLVAQTHIALSYFHIFHGEWEAFIAINIFLYEGGLRRHHQDHISWAVSGRGMLALRRQQNQLARGYFQYLVDLALTHKFPPVVHLMEVSGLALIACHEEDWDAAGQYAKHAASLGTKLHNTIFPMYDGYANLVEAHIRLWERAFRLGKQVAPARQAAYRDLKLLRRYTRLYPIGQPAQAHFQGWMAYLDGQENAARRLWDEGLQHAATHHMPYEELSIRQTRRRLLGDGYPQQENDERRIQVIATELAQLNPSYEQGETR